MFTKSQQAPARTVYLVDEILNINSIYPLTRKTIQNSQWNPLEIKLLPQGVLLFSKPVQLYFILKRSFHLFKINIYLLVKKQPIGIYNLR